MRVDGDAKPGFPFGHTCTFERVAAKELRRLSNLCDVVQHRGDFCDGGGAVFEDESRNVALRVCAKQVRTCVAGNGGFIAIWALFEGYKVEGDVEVAEKDVWD